MTPSEIAVDYLPCAYCGATPGNPCHARPRGVVDRGYNPGRHAVPPHADRTDAVRAAYLAGMYDGFSDGLATVVDTVRDRWGPHSADLVVEQLPPYYRAVLTRTP